MTQHNYFKSTTQCVSCVWPNHYFYWKTDFSLTKVKYFHKNSCFKTYEIQCSWTEQNLISLYNLLYPWKIQPLLEKESVKSLNSFISHYFLSKASQYTMQTASAMNYHLTLLITLSPSTLICFFKNTVVLQVLSTHFMQRLVFNILKIV